MVAKHEEHVAKSWEERYPEFLISIANDSALQVILSEIEVEFDCVIRIRSADQSRGSAPFGHVRYRHGSCYRSLCS